MRLHVLPQTLNAIQMSRLPKSAVLANARELMEATEDLGSEKNNDAQMKLIQAAQNGSPGTAKRAHASFQNLLGAIPRKAYAQANSGQQTLRAGRLTECLVLSLEFVNRGYLGASRFLVLYCFGVYVLALTENGVKTSFSHCSVTIHGIFNAIYHISETHVSYDLSTICRSLPDRGFIQFNVESRCSCFTMFNLLIAR